MKTVDKSGLPVVIGGVELTEKDLYCLAQHLQQYQRAVVLKKNDAPDACATCKYFSECFPNRVSAEWETAFMKLIKLTGVDCMEQSFTSSRECIQESVAEDCI